MPAFAGIAMTDAHTFAEDDRSAGAAKLKVFISYSRKDAQNFADELAGGLEFHGGFDVSLDRHSIVEGEEWKKRLGALIEDADSVVFIISPGSADSDICRWEIEEAARLSKRMLPVLWMAPRDGQLVPERLTELNYTRFDQGRSFVAGLKALVTALNTDIEWLREHTRLLSRALEWEKAHRLENRMLTGPDIAAAKSWAARRPKGAPELTAHHLDFIRASEEAEQFRNNALARQHEERARLLKEAEIAAEERATALTREENALRAMAGLQRRQAIATALALIVLAAGGWWGYQSWTERRIAEANRLAVEKEAAREDIRGQIVAYATDQGEFEADRAPGYETSPYTTPLARNLLTHNKSISEILEETHSEVTAFALSNDPTQRFGPTQRPFYSTSLNGHIYLLKQPASRKRHALIIAAPDPGLGEESVLTGPDHDAAAILSVLDLAGFGTTEITVLKNPTAVALAEAMAGIAATLRTGEKTGTRASFGNEYNNNTLLFVFFSGHGVTINGNRYLITNVLGARREDKEGIRSKSVEVQRILRDAQEAAAASIVIVDTHFPDCYGKQRQLCFPEPTR